MQNDTRRVRVQARQIYVFARAHYLGWCDSLDLAKRGMEILRQRACSPDGKPGWVHTLDHTGEVSSFVRDLYDHAFLVLAAAWLFRASGEQEYLELANEIVSFIEVEMTSPHDGFVESIGGPQLPRRQNPHMHLFEAMMALFDATRDPRVLERVDHLKQLFDRHFFQPESRVLLEYFSDDWSTARGDAAGIVEPGHLAEWVWLLAEYSRLTGAPLEGAARELFESSSRLGQHIEQGFLVASTTAAGKVNDAGSRCWMQTEWIRAAAVLADRSIEGAGRVRDQAITVLFKHHIDGARPGTWIDAVNDKGRATSQVVPASTLYHIMGAVIEAESLSGDADLGS